MRKFPMFFVFCLAVLSQCDLWNLPLTRSEEEAARMFQISEIYVAELPSPNVFVASDEPWLKTAKDWEDIGLVVYAIDGFDKAYRIEAGEHYKVAGENPEYDDKANLTKVTVTLQLAENARITTDFEITLYPAEEKYYKIEQYVDTEGKGRVIAYPSMVSESQLEQGPVTVTLYVYPADGYRIKSGYPILTPPPPDGSILPSDDNTFTMVPYDLQIEAEFEYYKAAKVNGKFYDTMAEAIGAATGGTAGSPVMITLIDNLTIDRMITLESGTHVRLRPEGEGITISREVRGDDSLFTVESGASLTLEGDGDNELIIDGGKEAGINTTGPLVTVNGGRLAIGDGVRLQNNSSRTNGGGVTVSGGGEFIMTGGTISGNSAEWSYGGGIYASADSSLVLVNVTISGNSANIGGGGIYADAGSSLVLINVTISGNSTGGGGGGIYTSAGSSLVLINVAITGNSADFGGGIYNCDDSSPLLINATIAGNKAIGDGGSGGGIYNFGVCSSQIQNSVIWGNSDPGISGSESVISYSIVQGVFDSDNGNQPDPGPERSPFTEWIDPTVPGWLPTTAGGYHLDDVNHPNNPAINAGSNGIYPANADAVAALLPSGVSLSPEEKTAINAALAKDAGGNTRIRQGDTIDMGAYEVTSTR